MQTRKQLLQAIAGGETVTIKGTLYGQHNINELPSEADLAAGDEKREAEAKASIESQIETLKSELGKLNAKKSEPKAEASDEKKSEVKETSKAEAPKAEAKSDAKK